MTFCFSDTKNKYDCAEISWKPRLDLCSQHRCRDGSCYRSVRSCGRCSVQPLQIPGYLLIVGFDLLEVVFGSAGNNYDILFAVYLLGLGIVGASVTHVLSGLAQDFPRWRSGVAGAFSVVGILSLVFALNVFLGTSQIVPVLTTAAAGLVMLAFAGWLVGLFGKQNDS